MAATMPFMGAPLNVSSGGLLNPTSPSSGPGLLGTAQGYGYPLTTGLLNAVGNAAQQPTDWSQVALQLAGNPHAGPYATNLGTVPPATGMNAGGSGSSGASTGSQIEGALLGLGKQAANPNTPLGKQVQGLLNPQTLSSADAATWASGAPANSAVSSALGNVANDGTAQAVQAANDAALADSAAAGASGLAAYGSGAAADAAVADQLGNVANDGTAVSVEAANDAALNATDGGGAGAGAGYSGSGLLGDIGTAAGLYSIGNDLASGKTGAAATTGAEMAVAHALPSLLGAGGAAALGIAALPAFLAAYVPDSAELTPSKIAQMESGVSAATKANGGLLGASYTQNPNGTINPQHYQTLNDLLTLESENPEEFAKAGGTGPITQFLQSMGYSPINWSAIPQGSYGRGVNNSGHQL